jgi:hypothetical protein
MFENILNSRIQNLVLQFSQIMIEKIAIIPYYIVANVYHPMSLLFSSPNFPLLSVPRVEDQNLLKCPSKLIKVSFYTRSQR